MFEALAVVGWLGAGVLAYGMWNYQARHRWQSIYDEGDSPIWIAFLTVTGPAAVVAGLLLARPLGISFNFSSIFTTEEREYYDDLWSNRP